MLCYIFIIDRLRNARYNSDAIYKAFHLCSKISLVRTVHRGSFANVFAKQVVYIEQSILVADSVSGLTMYVVGTSSLYSTAAEKSK